MSTNKVCVVIVNKNESRFAIDLITEFQKNDLKNVEIIIVDGDSTDNSVELIKQCGGAKVIPNTERPGPFGAFISGCKATDAEIVTCWSMDDLPRPGYIHEMRLATESFPMVDIVTCNCDVLREGTLYKRILFPYTTYISPDYAVKLFKAGYGKNFNVIGLFIRKKLVMKCWEKGGNNISVNFDGMYFFYSLFQKGIVNVGDRLVMYRSFPNSFGAESRGMAIKHAIEVHKKFYKSDLAVYSRAMEAEIWSEKNQATVQFALAWIMRLPKFARKWVYKYLYSYDWRAEKL